ncbi:hypothetical protein GCM10010193_39780 [Kitasatospora atroaurantiaca]|uniref:Aminotransferase class I and II n=1 Tax=Kitasatospora atroaurantiaca TaxID=285545 RepID=A0A561EKV2_9ACTN|nr:aminotransferase class I/II-fold pyridoxal phosphate-dependent enzyme [Kitasatospora atroaurantiaca]TWE16247.1 aminotransferase class I and II [Kitasatospora atroaurantiaca]
MEAPLFEMLAWHELVEAERQQPGGRLFISDYNGGHPFVEEYLGELARTPPYRLADVTRYAGIDEDSALRSKIAELHRRHDGVEYSPGQVIPAAGSSGLLGTFSLWLTLSGIKRVHYLPPVYYKLAYFFRTFGIEPVKAAHRHAHQPDPDLRLPDERTVLIMTDPVWYAGRRVPRHLLEYIGDWQRDTGSLVFVDGTFQYMRWDGELREDSALLPAEQTLRLVCPTKYLSIHGYRCARNDAVPPSSSRHGSGSLSHAAVFAYCPPATEANRLTTGTVASRSRPLRYRAASTETFIVLAASCSVSAFRSTTGSPSSGPAATDSVLNPGLP